jgi:hypothetical protein
VVATVVVAIPVVDSAPPQAPHKTGHPSLKVGAAHRPFNSGMQLSTSSAQVVVAASSVVVIIVVDSVVERPAQMPQSTGQPTTNTSDVHSGFKLMVQVSTSVSTPSQMSVVVVVVVVVLVVGLHVLHALGHIVAISSLSHWLAVVARSEHPSVSCSPLQNLLHIMSPPVLPTPPNVHSAWQSEG